jgi:hypothetical protein
MYLTENYGLYVKSKRAAPNKEILGTVPGWASQRDPRGYKFAMHHVRNRCL